MKKSRQKRPLIPWPDKFSAKVKRYIEENRRGIIELGREAGISAASMSRLLKRTQNPSAHQIWNLARTMRVPIEYLLDDSLDVPRSHKLTAEERTLVKFIRRLRVRPEDIFTLIGTALTQGLLVKTGGGSGPIEFVSRPVEVADLSRFLARTPEKRGRRKKPPRSKVID